MVKQYFIKLILVGITGLVQFYSNAQNVGIGTPVPQARLHVTDSSVLFSGPTTIPANTLFAPPASDAGARLMWYAQKAAFRVGIVDNASWNKDSIGRFSFATGFNTRAIGEGAFASGTASKAIGNYTTAMGFYTAANGIYATAIGYNTKAEANYSTSFGANNTSTGLYATSMGESTSAIGNYSTAIGGSTTALGVGSTAMGAYSIAKANYALVTGIYNDTTGANKLFEVGNGVGSFARSNAFTVLDNGNVGIGTPAPITLLEVNSTTNGVLLPRMTTEQKNAIVNPIEGLEVYDLTLHQKSYFNGSVWVALTATIVPAPAFVPMAAIVIGTQQWMRNNLDVAFYRNGDPIPQVTDAAAWVGLTTGAWCYYNNDSTLGNTYGKLYNWYAVNDPRGLAPEGWHVPSNTEWIVLENTLGSSIATGAKLKEAGLAHWSSPNTGGNNNSGFGGLPGGYRGNSVNLQFSNFGYYGYWWSSTEAGDFGAIVFYLINNSPISLRSSTFKNLGYSVRCLRD
ncbi:MAG: FISUMP domain-containing protein [Ferruginibacter sp.]